jgi:hypothetical protein
VLHAEVEVEVEIVVEAIAEVDDVKEEISQWKHIFEDRLFVKIKD